jgi:hypothetical protein
MARFLGAQSTVNGLNGHRPVVAANLVRLQAMSAFD